MRYEQKGYTITLALTSDPACDAVTRDRLVELLSETPKRASRGKCRDRYRDRPADERDWRRVSEQERRRMLKDYGWL
jgi:hypothetical protein